MKGRPPKVNTTTTQQRGGFDISLQDQVKHNPMFKPVRDPLAFWKGFMLGGWISTAFWLMIIWIITL